MKIANKEIFIVGVKPNISALSLTSFMSTFPFFASLISTDKLGLRCVEKILAFLSLRSNACVLLQTNVATEYIKELQSESRLSGVPEYPTMPRIKRELR